MKKKMIGATLALISLFSLGSCRSNEDNYREVDGVAYTLYTEKEYEVGLLSSFKGDTFTVPTTFLKKNVTQIADQGFKNQKNLKKVILHDNIVTIDKNAFWGSGIEEIEILQSVTTIGNYAFYDCDSLVEITIPASVYSIGNCMFVNCDNLVTVNYPVAANKIPWGMFDGCKSLEFTIGDKVLEIGGYAFRGNSMTNLTIPSHVKTIGESAYKQCMNLTNVVLEEGVENLGFEAFLDCPNLKTVSLPSSLKKVEDKALYGNALEITYNDTKEKFQALNIKLSQGTIVTCLDGTITI